MSALLKKEIVFQYSIPYYTCLPYYTRIPYYTRFTIENKSCNADFAPPRPSLGTYPDRVRLFTFGYSQGCKIRCLLCFFVYCHDVLLVSRTFLLDVFFFPYFYLHAPDELL